MKAEVKDITPELHRLQPPVLQWKVSIPNSEPKTYSNPTVSEVKHTKIQDLLLLPGLSCLSKEMLWVQLFCVLDTWCFFTKISRMKNLLEKVWDALMGTASSLFVIICFGFLIPKVNTGEIQVFLHLLDSVTIYPKGKRDLLVERMLLCFSVLDVLRLRNEQHSY